LTAFRLYFSFIFDKSVKRSALICQKSSIYPEQQIASVNFFQFPEKTPIHFEITSDAPMNSFWIPELGGQIYAMSGMKSQLHLMADAPGNYRGLSANISGDGFSGMNFIAKASSETEFNEWVQAVRTSSPVLNLDSYKKIAEPSAYDPESFYRLGDLELFDEIIMKYMMPMSDAMKEGA
jgi:Heme/copper-type cytochrome/quinol oxidases, subunit 2